MSAKERLLELNSRFAEKLTSKGVEVSGDETTTELIDKVDEIQTGGSDSWYDTFWDNFLDPNAFTGNSSFSGAGWNDITFNPNQDIILINSVSTCSGCYITNLKAILDKNNIKLITSQCTRFNGTFQNSKITHLPTIDLSQAPTYKMSNVFSGCAKLQYIEKIIASNFMGTGSFNGCSALVEVTVEGIISGGDVNVGSSPLDSTSAKSFISCLENYAGTENEFLYTITFSE